MNFVPEHSQSVPLRRGSEMKSTPQDVSVSIKQEPGVIDIKGNLASRIRKEAVGLNQQSVKSASSSTVPLAAAIQGSSSVYVCNDAAPADPSFPIPVTAWRILNEPSSTRQLLVEGGSTLTHSTTSAWTQEVQSNNRTVEQALPEPEHFPVISSVFSLSQQPEDAQGSIQPLVMALRGIVMSKTNSSEKLSPAHISLEPKEEKPASGYCAEAVTKDGPLIHDQLLTEQTSESVKIEEPDKTFQHTDTTENCTNIKEESTSTPPMDNNMCSQTPASSSSTVHQEAVCQISSHRDVSVTADPRLQTPIVLKNEHDVSSRVLTVSLKRIQVGTWKRSKKRLKLRISKCKTQVPMGSLTDCAIIHPTPLKVDQLVKRPGPNQPVVVLNHPKPQVPKGGARATTSVEDTESSEVVPKCQILKMRLSKVMGQKYEVMGCTVRVFP
ncbi:hypothetical protein LDENG_00023140 [Lucifuga dentata]|nr:hypothetical protein LDENG_00023140 [Lucifuga dentata]